MHALDTAELQQAPIAICTSLQAANNGLLKTKKQ
jgi:hypothetical protein